MSGIKKVAKPENDSVNFHNHYGAPYVDFFLLLFLHFKTMLFSDIKPSFFFEIKRTPELYLLCVLSTETLSIYLSLILKDYSKKFWKTERKSFWQIVSNQRFVNSCLANSSKVYLHAIIRTL